ncbi:GM15139 [Drosophila sechellia]|uniref:GM15139 n=1 Tax=Drosophila sechellia TaxID=7238 RepID=B4IBY9_DROSE|nr:GM15139 [Drosophila sechellia]
MLQIHGNNKESSSSSLNVAHDVLASLFLYKQWSSGGAEAAAAAAAEEVEAQQRGRGGRWKELITVAFNHLVQSSLPREIHSTRGPIVPPLITNSDSLDQLHVRHQLDENPNYLCTPVDGE